MAGRLATLGAADVKIIAGSACFWAWLDGMFMSAFFRGSHAEGLMAELAVVLLFGVSAIGFAAFLAWPRRANQLLGGKQVPLTAAVLGAVGSALFAVAGAMHTAALLVVGGACCAICMAMFQMGWGAVYCRDGARSAALYASGGFAGAVIIDLPLLFMVPLASMVFYALLPLVSGMLLVSISGDERRYQSPEQTASSGVSLLAAIDRRLGIPRMLLLAAALVLVSFGYLQHLVSFSSAASGGTPGGVVVQLTRGAMAVILFFVVVCAPSRTNILYRMGLLLIIAGFMLMPFLFGSGLFWVAGAIIISGYTAFDLLVWVLFSQIAHTRSESPLQTIAVIKLLAVICYVLGAVTGMVLVGNDETLHAYVLQETTLMGYLVMIATVLLLSSKDMWALSGMVATSSGASGEEARRQCLDQWFGAYGLTPREQEIAHLLIAGRTQPWVAASLCISENTVGTHVRHIYQKLGVHDRQQFIDLANDQYAAASPDSREAVS